MRTIVDRAIFGRAAGKADRGTAAIEFAIIAPVLMILLIGIVELGLGVQQAMQVQNAAEAGAVYAGKHGWDAGAIAAAVVNASDAGGLAASPAPVLFCGCPGAGGIASMACNGKCPDGSAAEQYVRVSASMPHTVLLTGLGLPIPSTLTAHATVRVQ